MWPTPTPPPVTQYASVGRSSRLDPEPTQSEEEGHVALAIDEPAAGILDPPGDRKHLQTVTAGAGPFWRREQRKVVPRSERPDESQTPPSHIGDRLVGPGPAEGALRDGDRPDDADGRDDPVRRSFEDELGRVEVPVLASALEREARDPGFVPYPHRSRSWRLHSPQSDTTSLAEGASSTCVSVARSLH